MSLRSFGLVALVSLAAAGCKKDPPQPEAEAASSASAKPGRTRGPVAPVAKVDPPAMKDYRVDVCYYGTLSFAQARDAYLASLGKDEPSEKRLPSFGPNGAPNVSAPANLAKDAKGDKAKPAATGSAAVAAGTASAKPSVPDANRRGLQLGARPPHERNARACNVAVQIKDAPMGEVDAALAAYGPYALDLSKTISAATTYYQREEYKKDSFAKGKELHKKLVEAFKKLDEMQGKLGTALTAWRKEHAPDQSKWEEGQKLATAAFESAREILVAGTVKKPDAAAIKASREKLEKDIEALKTFSTANKEDPWGKMVPPALEGFLKASKDIDDKSLEAGLKPDQFVALVASFAASIEAKHRALNRWLVMKGQTQEPRAGADRMRLPGMGRNLPRSPLPNVQPTAAATAAP